MVRFSPLPVFIQLCRRLHVFVLALTFTLVT